MADAIPVHSKPKKVAVEPTEDRNGVAIPADYVSTNRENLGNPSDFVSTVASVELDDDGVPVNAKVKHKLPGGWAWSL
jgi:hypothetical protein